MDRRVDVASCGDLGFLYIVHSCLSMNARISVIFSSSPLQFSWGIFNGWYVVDEEIEGCCRGVLMYDGGCSVQYERLSFPSR